MAARIVPSVSFVASPLSPPRHHPRLLSLPLFNPQRLSTRVRVSFHEIPPPHEIASLADLNGILDKAEGMLYALADADPAVVQKSGGWFAFIADAMEVVLKVILSFRLKWDSYLVTFLLKEFYQIGFVFFLRQVLKDILSGVHVPYSYGFAIILLTFIVKVATYPLTKQQVSSSISPYNFFFNLVCCVIACKILRS